MTQCTVWNSVIMTVIDIAALQAECWKLARVKRKKWAGAAAHVADLLHVWDLSPVLHRHRHKEPPIPHLMRSVELRVTGDDSSLLWHNGDSNPGPNGREPYALPTKPCHLTHKHAYLFWTQLWFCGVMVSTLDFEAKQAIQRSEFKSRQNLNLQQRWLSSGQAWLHITGLLI